MRCDVIVDGVADREAEIAMIVAMGATIEDAVQFIEDYGGNVDLAIEALFRHDFQVRTKESSELACYTPDGSKARGRYDVCLLPTKKFSSAAFANSDEIPLVIAKATSAIDSDEDIKSIQRQLQVGNRTLAQIHAEVKSMAEVQRHAKADAKKRYPGQVILKPISNCRCFLQDMPTKQVPTTSLTKMSKVNEFMQSMTVRGDDKASSLEMQSNAVYKRIEALAGLNDARPALPLWREYKHVHHMFDFWANTTPHATALEIWQDCDYSQFSFTYKELNQKVNKLAAKLLHVTRGLPANKVATIHIPRSAELVIAILGAAKIGMTFVAVDTEELPLPRLHYILKDTSSNILLTSHHESESPKIKGVHHLYVEDIIMSRPSKTRTIAVATTTDDDLLALIYTSGSTGNPKGVMIHHGAFANYHAVEQRMAGVTPNDRIVHTQSISFVSGVGEVFRAMCAGATLLMCGTAIRRLGPDLLPWLEARQVTVFKAVPSMLRGLITPEPPVLQSLRLIIASGEACTKEIVDFFSPSVVLLNTYGPTETCSNNMFKVLRPGDQITIGVPYPTFRIHLLDEKLNESLTYGQICVSGLSVAKGYLNVETEAFIQHPQLGRLYLTGDIGEMQNNGEMRYSGRTDAQVKIKGYRLELGEVESKLLTLSSVAEAAVVHRDGRLHAFVVLHVPSKTDVSAFSLADWRKALKNSGLGDYALPHSMTVLKAMPRTVSGKIDRKQLSLPDVVIPNGRQDSSTTVMIDPSSLTPLEVVVNAFTKALGRTQGSCKASTHFFENGGDSSASGLLISHLRNCGPFFSRVSVKDLYLNPTPAELVSAIDSFDGATIDGYVANNTSNSPSANNLRLTTSLSKMYHGKWIRLIQFLYFVGTCLMDGVAVRIGIWCLLYSRVWLFSLVGINAEEWGSGIKNPIKMISIHAVLIYCLFYVVAWMWFYIWYLILFLAKWILIGVYTPGLKTSRSFFIRNWIVGRIASRIPWSTVYGGPLGNLMLSLLGAKIGKRAYVAVDSRAPIDSGFDCIEIGEDASINHAFVSGVTMYPLGIDVGRVRVLDRAVVDPRSTLVGHNTLMEDSHLGNLSSMRKGDEIPSGEYWTGSPAEYTRETESPPPSNEIKGMNIGYRKYHYLRTVYTFFAHLGIGIPLAFTTAVLLFVTNNWWTPLVFVFFILFHVPWAAIIMIVIPALYIKAINKFNDLSAGNYHLYCWQSLLISLKQGLFAIPQGLLNNTYFLVDWMRWCGATIGCRSEIARVRGAVPDMMDFGDETFLANWTHVATPQIIGRVLQVGNVKVGNKFLAGNRSVLPINTELEDDVILGVLSLAPTKAEGTYGKTFIGNPCFAVTSSPRLPYPEPKGFQAASRRIWDVIAICMPLALLAALSISWFLLAHVFHQDSVFPYVIHSAAAGFIVRISYSFLTAKWLYWYFENGCKPSIQEYWSAFNHRWHIYSKVWALFIRPTILTDIEGSWFMNKFFTTCTDMKIGEGSYLACSDAFREHDLVRIGKGSVINTFGELRTHTFEDWKLRLNVISIGDYCAVGHSSTLMANSMMLDCSEAGHNTFVMKNEVLQPFTNYVGLPAAPRGPSAIAQAQDNGYEQPSEHSGDRQASRVLIFAAAIVMAAAVLSGLIFVLKETDVGSILAAGSTDGRYLRGGALGFDGQLQQSSL
jgi:non-ribosomal peptide synthetase-like protein